MAGKGSASSERVVPEGMRLASSGLDHRGINSGGSHAGGRKQTGGVGCGGDGVAAHVLGRERVIDIQRARIVAAMVKECAERGVGNVTVAHVVARAGVSRRTFYELFEDREDCFLGAFDEGIARASRYVLEGYDPNAAWVRRVRSALGSLLSFLDVERELGQLLIVGSLGAGHRALRRRQRGIAQITALIEEGAALAGTGESVKAGTEPPPLTAEGVVGGVLSVLHARLIASTPLQGAPHDVALAGAEHSLIELTGPLMSMIVLPYLGPAAARRELARAVPKRPTDVPRLEGNPLGELEMRLTYRTVRVLMAIAAHPGSSNRTIADAAEVTDQGQMSKLLARLHDIGLVANTGGGAARGEPNAWTLTEKGWRVQAAIAEQTTGS
jgi:AcrR family transcriptional regulator/DNA-binding MarR family transcriptional regulator